MKVIEYTNSEYRSGGIGFSGLLAVTFIILKLTHVIDWPWVWVLAPLWIPLALVALIFLFVIVLVLLVGR